MCSFTEHDKQKFVASDITELNFVLCRTLI